MPRFIRRLGIVVLLYVSLNVVCTTLSVLELRKAADAAHAVRSSLGLSDLGSTEPERHLIRIHQHAARARRLVRNPVVAPATVLPIVGRQLRSLGALAAAGEDLGRRGAEGAARVRTLVVETPTTAAGRTRLVGTLADELRGVYAEVSAIDLGPDEALVGPLDERRRALQEDLDDAVDRLAAAERSARTVHDLLQGPRRYLLLAANNAEMRNGSGTFLTAALLTTNGGAFDLGEAQRTSELVLPAPGVPVEGDLAERWGFTGLNREWRNLGMSPRFDATAALAARMWEAKTGDRIDGVLAVDVVALSAILESTGPIDVDGQRFDAHSIVDHLLHDQYGSLGDDDTRTQAQAERREQLGQIAEAATQAIEAGGFDSRELARGLLEAANGRHILVWAANAEEQQGWVDAGVSGRLGPDSLLVSVVNRAGNKLDHFLRPEVALRSEPAARGRGTDFTLEVDLHNEVGDDEVPYVAGPAEGVTAAPGTYIGIVAVHVPADATGVSLEGGKTVVGGPDGPTRVIGGEVVLERGASTSVVVRFTRPSEVGTIRIEPSARVPGSRWRLGERSFTDRKPRTLSYAPSRSVNLR